VTDISQQISAVRRSVGTRTIEAGEARVVTVSQAYDTSVEDLWGACTTAERIPRWFLPITGELRLGGRYQLEGNAGGVIERCDPPGGSGTPGFVATWEYGGGMSWVDVRFTPEPGGGARMTMEHVAHVDDAFWEEFGPGAVGVGWDSGLLGLARHLGSGLGPAPDEAMAWLGSDEGQQFLMASSEEWYAAHIASGADRAAARAAADRTTAAYTAAPDPAG
jgi:uncharacterized protein YndB with AHSA1/START domain